MTPKEWNGRWQALAAILALAALAALAVAWWRAGGSISYTGSPANPSGGREDVAVIPVGQRQPVPPMAFSAPDGSPLDLAAFRGRTVLVNLWATWCPPCIAEMPDLDGLQANLGGPRFQVVTVSLDMGGKAIAARWLEKSGLAHLQAYTADPAKFPDTMLPQSLLIDAQGRLAWQGLGAKKWTAPPVEAAISAVIAETEAGAKP